MTSVRHSKAKVVIVGAGMAGVTAAVKLLHNGLSDVLVLEAQDYIGGRIKAAYRDNKPLDLGAQFCHGRGGNPLFDIAHKLDRVLFPDETSDEFTGLRNDMDTFYVASGEKVQASQVKHLLDALNKAFEDEDKLSQYSDTASAMEPLDEVYQQFLNSEKTMTNGTRELYDAVLSWFCKFICIDNGIESVNQLALEDDYLELPGDRWTDIQDGMVGLLRTISDLLPKDKDLVRLNTPVTNINWDYTAQSDVISQPGVQITCENGDVITAEHVICTVSMGCLKAGHHKMFNPPLPATKRQIIENIGWGAIGKVFLFWKEPFWTEMKRNKDDYFETFEFLWLKSQTPSIPSDKSKLKTKNGRPWWYGIFSIETVYNHPGCLELWLTRDQVEVAEQLDDTEVMQVITDVLRACIPDVEIPDPVDIRRTKWMSNPYTRGTYCHFTPQLSKTDREHLATPIPSVNPATPDFPQSKVNPCHPRACVTCDSYLVSTSSEPFHDRHRLAQPISLVRDGQRDIHDLLTLLNDGN